MKLSIISMVVLITLLPQIGLSYTDQDQNNPTAYDLPEPEIPEHLLPPIPDGPDSPLAENPDDESPTLEPYPSDSPPAPPVILFQCSDGTLVIENGDGSIEGVTLN